MLTCSSIPFRRHCQSLAFYVEVAARALPGPKPGVSRAEKNAFRCARERLTLLRRDVVKLIEMGIEENNPGNWGRYNGHTRLFVRRLPRSAPRQLMEEI